MILSLLSEGFFQCVLLINTMDSSNYSWNAATQTWEPTPEPRFPGSAFTKNESAAGPAICTGPANMQLFTLGFGALEAVKFVGKAVRNLSR